MASMHPGFKAQWTKFEFGQFDNWLFSLRRHDAVRIVSYEDDDKTSHVDTGPTPDMGNTFEGSIGIDSLEVLALTFDIELAIFEYCDGHLH